MAGQIEAKLVTKDMYWVGSLDPKLRVFDIVMSTPYGTTYNSYLLKGTKANVLFETVKENFWEECEQRLATILKPTEKIDYIVLNHTEPDHSGALHMILDKYPEAIVVATATAHTNLEAITYRNYKKISISDTATAPTIDVGGYTLRFIVAPFLHWPDTMFTYVPELKALITCDFLGSHYSYDKIFNDIDFDTEAIQHEYLDALKNYYDPIFGPFKPYVLKGLEYIKDLPISVVCCSHGPVLRKGIEKITAQYKEWSIETPLEQKVVIAFVSAYKYTRVIAETLYEAITKAGVPAIMFDMVEKGVGEVMAEVGKCKGLLLGTPTIIGDALPPIWQVAVSMNPIIHRDHVVGVFGSHGWSGEGTRNITERMNQLRFRMPLQPLEIRFKPSTQQITNATEWGTRFARAIKGETLPEENTPSRKVSLVRNPKNDFPNDGKMRRWKCIICGEIVLSITPPDVCRACGAGVEAFVCLGLAEVDHNGPKASSVQGHVVIVGGGAAAISALKAVKEANNTAKVTLINGESELPYYRPYLTRAMSEPMTRNDPSFRLLPEKWCEDNKVDLKVGVSATALNTTSRVITLSNKEELVYDKLIIATGGKSFVPLKELPRVGAFNVRELSDVDQIIEYARTKPCKTAIILGGGLTGLETAEALTALGLTCHVVELMNRILPRQLTEEGSRVYSSALAAAHVIVHTSTLVKKCKTDDGGVFTGVELGDGSEVLADILCIGVGTSPNTELARAGGITIGKRAIAVTETMETNVPGVYACGDCAEFGNYTPTWPEAVAQGRAAGLRAVDATMLDGATFKREPSPYYLPSFVPVFSMGMVVPVEGCCPAPTVVTFRKPAVLCDLFFNASKVLVGAQVVGAIAKQLQTPLSLALNKATIGDALDIVAFAFAQ